LIDLLMQAPAPAAIVAGGVLGIIAWAAKIRWIAGA
jgi:hypothetical protein